MISFGLNMIVGPGEAGLLKRCLESFDAKKSFDEIVIVNTSLDKNIDLVAGEFTDKVFNYPWETPEHPYGDFGGARDFARQNSTADKLMWLDTDDVLLEQYKESWNKTRDLIKDEAHRDVLIWSMPYALLIDEAGNPLSWFRRERVFDRKEIQWRRPVHELMFPEWEMVRHAKLNNIYITHLPMKPSYTSAVRNVKILEHEVQQGNKDTQTKYFLGRDMMFVGRSEEGVKMLEEIVSDLSTSYEMLYAIAIDIIWFYAYGNSDTHPDIEKFKLGNLQKAESWCRLALSFTNDYAEPYVLLGDVYWHKNELDAAMKMYLTATKKQLGVGKFQTVPLYNEIPFERLSRVFEAKGMLEMALHWNKKLLNVVKTMDYLVCRGKLIKALSEEMEDVLNKN